MKRLACAIVLVCAALTLPACGYSLAGRGSFLPAYVKTIGVPTFANRTTIFNLETIVTERVRSEFIGRGKYTILPQATGNLDAVLNGEITAVTLTPASFTVNQVASRYAITMTARIELRDMHANTVLWDNPSVMFRQEYEAVAGNVVTDPTAFFNQQANALDRVSAEFARTIVSAILEAF